MNQRLSQRHFRIISKRAAEQLSFQFGDRQKWEVAQQTAYNNPEQYVKTGLHMDPNLDAITFPMLQNLVQNNIKLYNNLVNNFIDPRFYNINLLAMRRMIENNPEDFLANNWWKYEKIVPKNDPNVKALLDYALNELAENDVYAFYRFQEEYGYNIEIPPEADDKARDTVSDMDPKDFFESGFAHVENLSDLTSDFAVSFAVNNPEEAYDYIENYNDILYYAGDTLAISWAKSDPEMFFTVMWEDRERLKDDFEFDIPERAIKIAGKKLAETDPDKFFELGLQLIPELQDINLEDMDPRKLTMDEDLLGKYKLTANVKEQNFPSIREDAHYQTTQRHPSIKGSKRYDFIINPPLGNRDFFRIYNDTFEEHSEAFHDIGTNSIAKSFALISFKPEDATILVEEMQSDWPSVMHDMVNDKDNKKILVDKYGLENYKNFMKEMSEHMASYPYIIIHKLAEFAKENGFDTIKISSPEAIEAMTGGVTNKRKLHNVYYNIPKSLGFVPSDPARFIDPEDSDYHSEEELRETTPEEYAWYTYSGDMSELSNSAQDMAHNAVSDIYKKRDISKRKTKKSKLVDIDKIQPIIESILGDRAKAINFSSNIGDLMQSIQKAQKDKIITNKEKNQLTGLITKHVIASLDKLIIKVAVPLMEKPISKRAKVTSDKPAYKEKKKTDKGYVWVYDEKHVEKRWKEKKEKMKSLEKNLKKVREKYQKDLTSEDPKTRAIAAIVGIMDDTAMRIGNEESAKEGTYGATTLKVKHVKGTSGNMTFDFPGKGAIEQNVVLKNNKVIKVIRDLMKGKKKDDFIFEIDGKKIWDRTVNRYLKEFDISAKDLRGFHANRLMKEQLKKKDFKDALKEVAEIVGHEEATLKNQYLDPELVEKHEKKDNKKKKASLSKRSARNPDDPLYGFFLTNENIKRIYELEYKLFELGERDYLEDPANIKKQQYTEELSRLLLKALRKLQSEFIATITEWINDAGGVSDRNALEHVYGKEAVVLMDLIDDLDIWLDNAFGGQYDIKQGMSLFNRSIQAAHTGGMISIDYLTIERDKYVPEKPINLTREEKNEMLSDLTEGKNTEQWKEEINRISHRSISKRAYEQVEQSELGGPELESRPAEEYYDEEDRPNMSIPDRRPVNLNLNVSNIDAKTKIVPLVATAWKIIAPFLPPGAALSSGFRSEMDQATIIRRFWKDEWGGYFAKNFPEKGRTTRQKWHFMTQEYPDLKRKKEKGEPLPIGSPDIPPGGPKTVSIALPGESKHQSGVAFDIRNIENYDSVALLVRWLNKVLKAYVNFVAFKEPDQHAVHIKINKALYPGPKNLEHALRMWKYGETFPNMYISQSYRPLLSKRAELTEEDKKWVEKIKPGISSRTSGTSIFHGAIDHEILDIGKDLRKEFRLGENTRLSPLVFSAWMTIKPFLDLNQSTEHVRVTSGSRNAEDQKRILSNYWKKKTNQDIPKHMWNDNRMWEQISVSLKKRFGLIVGPPTYNPDVKYSHGRGNAFDVSGGDLYTIKDVVNMVSQDNRIPVKLKAQVEDKNNAVHISVISATYDENAIIQAIKERGNRVASISKRATEGFVNICDIYEDFMASNPVEDMVLEFESVFGMNKCAADSWMDEMGFGVEDEPGDWFEKSHIFRWVDDEEEDYDFDRDDISDSEAKKLSEEDPEQFFYRGLHKEFPDLEPKALDKIIEDNPKFFFVFKYHEDEEDSFSDLTEKAAEGLALQDPRAFFYYHLHHKYPELGRGAIVHLVDKDPRSFGQLGLGKDYPDYEQAASDAINIYDPTKVDTREIEEKTASEEDQSKKYLSVRDDYKQLDKHRGKGEMSLEEKRKDFWEHQFDIGEIGTRPHFWEYPPDEEKLRGRQEEKELREWFKDMMKEKVYETQDDRMKKYLELRKKYQPWFDKYRK